MYKDGLVYVEYTTVDGVKGYFIVNDEGSVVENKLPFPLRDYIVKIPEDMEVRRETQTLPNKFRKIHVVLKWDRSVDYILDPEGKLQQISIKGGAQINQRNKEISPQRIEGP